jgi:hypothetical protein
MTEYDNTNRGTLFRNDRKQTDKHADYTGKLNVGGKDFWISAWTKEGRKGSFLSLSVKPMAPAADWVSDGDGKAKVVREEQSISQQATAKIRKPDPISSGRSLKADMDDDIPFSPEVR